MFILKADLSVPHIVFSYQQLSKEMSILYTGWKFTWAEAFICLSAYFMEKKQARDMASVSVLDSPAAEPEMRIREQFASLGDDPSLL